MPQTTKPPELIRRLNAERDRPADLGAAEDLMLSRGEFSETEIDSLHEGEFDERVCQRWDITQRSATRSNGVDDGCGMRNKERLLAAESFVVAVCLAQVLLQAGQGGDDGGEGFDVVGADDDVAEPELLTSSDEILGDRVDAADERER